MTASADTMPSAAAPVAKSDAPPLWLLLLIFWSIFAVSVTAVRILDPAMFVGADPDNLMRLASVRDLVAGQAWFDLTQYRMDPPAGSLLHWSRLIDAPMAALVIFGNLFGIGEPLALTAWPLLLLLGFMAGAMLTATALGGRAAAVPALIFSLVFLDPLLFYLPNDIDHHNAQHTLLILTLAAFLRLSVAPALGIAVGCGLAMTMAIGLEMLPYVGIIAIAVALRWATGHDAGRAAAWFGVSFAAGLALLYAGTASPQAAFACDSLSLSYVVPIGAAGLGLAVLALFLERGGSLLLRMTGLGILAAVTGAIFLLIAPGCLGGPYGFLSPELKALFLDTVMEAQPLPVYFMREPVGAIATVGPPVVALVVAFRRCLSGGWLWSVPLALLGVALALSLYQVRTIPVANSIAIPILAAWLAEVVARHSGGPRWSLRHALPVVGAFLLAFPMAHLVAGWAAVEAVSIASFGAIAPRSGIEASGAAAAGLPVIEKDCLDPASAALLDTAPDGLVMAPVFYGPAVLTLSTHSVVSGPYHRSGEAILDTIHAIRSPPEEARSILARRGVDYVAICTTSLEAGRTMREAPDGLLAALMGGEAPDWLEPVTSGDGAMLRLWRVRG